MQVFVSFRHMEPSEPLRDYAEEKLVKVVGKYIKGNFDARVTLSVQKFRHIVNLMVNYKGFSIKSEESSEDMYSSIDLAMDKLERQVRRYKDKLRTFKSGALRTTDVHRLSYDHAVIAAPEDDFDDENEEFFEEAADYIADSDHNLPEREDPRVQAPETPVIVLKREKITAQPMNIEEAIMQLDLQQAHFVVFTNQTTSSINVLYKRDDGNFGLIEPQSS